MKSSRLTFLSTFFTVSLSLGLNAYGQLTSPTTVEESFQQRLLLRTQVHRAEAQKIRNLMTDLRYLEDVLGEKKINNTRIGITDNSPTGFGDTAGTLINPKFPQLTFQSGDVLLVRGTSTISTTIATMMDSTTQFSHTLIVYIDPKSGKSHGIESLLDQGLVVRPLDTILNEGLPRMALYRHTDPAISSKAGQIAYDTAMAYISKGKTYPYDFKLLYTDYKEMYCAELIRMAYDLASQGEIKIPTFVSTLGRKFSETKKMLGMSPKPIKVYAPVDIDLEPSFDLVAEWRDYKATVNFRIKDRVLVKLFQWIEQGVIEYDLSQFASLVDDVKRARSENSQGAPMDPSKLKQFTDKANDVMNAVTAKILEVDDQHVKSHGKNMTAPEIDTYLETVRSSTDFQKILRPGGFLPKVPRCSVEF